MGVGVLSALVGIGGSALISVILIMVFGLDPKTAIGTTLTMTIFTALSATFAYGRQGRIDYRLGLLSSGIGVPGALVGAYATRFFPPKFLGFSLGLVLAILSIKMIMKKIGGGPKQPLPNSPTWSRKFVDRSGQVFRYKLILNRALPLFFLPGLIAGFVGIGGGAISASIYLMSGVPIHLAIATSMFAMISTSVFGSAVHYSIGNVSTLHAIPSIIGISAGTQVGAWIANRTSPKNLARVFAVSLLGIGFWLISRFWIF